MVVIDRNDQCTEDDKSKYDKDQGNQCLVVETSSSVKTQVAVVLTLTQISLFIRVNKENSLEFLLDFVCYLYTFNCLSVFTDPMSLHN